MWRWFIFYDYHLIQFLRWCEVWRWFRIHRFDPPNWPSAEDFSRYLSSEGKSAPSYSEYLNFQKFTKGALWSYFRLALSARTFQEMMGLVDWFSDCVCWAVAELMSEFIWLHETFQCQPFFLRGTRYWRVSIHSIASAKNCFRFPFSDNMKTRDALHHFQPSWCCVTKFLQGHFWTFIIGKSSESQNQPITPAKFSPLDPRRMGLEYECLLGYASAAFSGFKAGVWYFEAAIFNTLAPSSTNIWRWYHDSMTNWKRTDGWSNWL